MNLIRVILTGGTSGIGRAIYKKLSSTSEKYQFAILSRNANKHKNFFDESSLLINTDLTIQEDIEKALQIIQKTMGGADILINNAGVSFPQLFKDSSNEESYKTILTNLMGPIILTRGVLPWFIKQKYGTIVNITSAAAIVGIPGLATYCASKFGLRGFSEALRKEVAKHGIKVIEILPGGVNTPIHNTLKQRRGNRAVHLENALNPSDAANAVYYSISQPHDVLISEIHIKHSSLKMVGEYT